MRYIFTICIVVLVFFAPFLLTNCKREEVVLSPEERRATIEYIIKVWDVREKLDIIKYGYVSNYHYIQFEINEEEKHKILKSILEK